MGISIRDGKYLSGARKILHAYFSYVDLYNITSTALEIGTITLDELSLISNANIVIPTSQQAGLYYIDLYLPFTANTAFNAGDNFDIAWYNASSYLYPDIEDSGFGYHFIMNSSDAYCRHSFMADLSTGISYTVIIRNNTPTDYNTSNGFIRMYKL